MNEKWTIGIDVAGNGICFQIQNRNGFKLAEGAAPKSMDGYRTFEEACLSHGVNWKQTLIVIEATGRHHLPWCERLLECGAHVFALNPLLTKRLYSSGLSGKEPLGVIRRTSALHIRIAKPAQSDPSKSCC